MTGDGSFRWKADKESPSHCGWQCKGLSVNVRNLKSEQSDDTAVFCDVDAFCGGNLGKTGHGHDVAGQNDDEACACGDLDVADGDGEAFGCAEELLVIGEAVLRFCHANGKLVKAECSQSSDLLLCSGFDGNALATVNAGDDLGDLFFEGILVIVCEGEIVGLFAETNDLFCERFAALAAFRPYGGEYDIDTELTAFFDDQIDLGIRVGGETVYGYDGGELIYVTDIGNVAEKVGNTLFECFQIFRCELGLIETAVHLERADGRNDDDCGGSESCGAAFDIEELFCAKVCAKSCFSNRIVPHF